MRKNILIVSLIALATDVFALVPASISSNSISTNKMVNLTISLPNSSAKPNFAPLSADFQIVGTASSSSTSIINGSISSENKLVVSLVPKRAGKLTIPSLYVGNDHTQSFSINVVTGNNLASNQQPSALTTSEALLFKTSIDASNGYVGVPIDLTVKLYYAVNISGVTLPPIVIDGIHVETDGKNKQYQTTENGYPYMVVEQHFKLTPTKTGTITIPALTATGMVDSNPNRIISINAGQPFTLQSKPITLNIKEIPNHIDPTKWLPATNVSVTDNWSSNSQNIIAGDPITRTITINATNADASSIPELEFESINGVNIYPEKAQKITNTQSSKQVGSKVFKIVYIPNQDGQINIPEITIPWWNLTTNKEESVQLPAKQFNVTGAIAVKDAAVAQEQSESDVNNTTTNNNVLLYALLGLIAAIIIGLISLFIIKRRKSESINKIDLADNSESKQTKIIEKVKNNSINELLIAITSQDIKQINHTLINWVNDKFATKIYSISEIKKLANNENLDILIDELTAALYNNQKFTKFDELTHMINTLSLSKKDKPASNKNSLPNLYPDL